MILKGKISVYAIKYNNEYMYVLLKDGKTFCLQNDELKPYELTVTKHFFKNTLFNAVADGGISDKEVEKISYSKNDIIAVVTKYNQSKNYDSEVLTYKLEKKSYLIAGLSANPIDKNDYEVLANISYRFYIPRFSKTTSLNFGLQYSYRESKTYYLDSQNERQISNPISSGIFLPMFVQQNILNRSVRPYFRGGFSLVYTHQKNMPIAYQTDKGFQKNYGICLLYGLGVEVDVYKGLMFRSDAYIDALKHLITAGIAYRWSLN